MLVEAADNAALLASLGENRVFGLDDVLVVLDSYVGRRPAGKVKNVCHRRILVWKPFQHYQSALRHAASVPPGHEKAKSRVRRPDLFWIDIGVMPAIRPEAISNRVRLSNEVRAAMRRLVAEDGAVDSRLPAVVDELSPYETGVSTLRAQDDLLAGSDEQLSLSAVCVSVSRVVTFIQFKTVLIAILGEPPEGSSHAFSTRFSVLSVYRTNGIYTRYSEEPKEKAPIKGPCCSSWRIRHGAVALTISEYSIGEQEKSTTKSTSHVHDSPSPAS